jgi:nicotinamide-nucleotide amidase
MLFPSDFIERAARIVALSRDRGRLVATAESCTGGALAALLTEIPGSSSCLERGFVTYSNEAKAEMLGVPMDLIAEKGAVSAEVAAAMAKGALAHSHADIAVSITGVAGPGGGTQEKPVGLVYFGGMVKGGKAVTERHRFEGERDAVRQQSVAVALQMIERFLQL